MEAQQSIWLALSYFTSLDYLAVQEWIHATFLYPDTINPTESPIYHNTEFYEGSVDCTPLGVPCTRFMAVISFANPALPHVLTTYLAL